MRTRKCKNCGKIFEVPTGSERYLCDECAKKSKRDSVLRERECRMCGTSFLGYPRSFFCPKCRAEREKEQRKKRRIRHKSMRPLGSTDFCESCGQPYTVKSGNQRYCPDCSREAISENIRAHKRKYMQENKEGFQAIKRDTLGKRYICVVCGKEFKKHTAEVTCSEACRKEHIRRRQNEMYIRQGKRKNPADAHYDSGLPKSGVVGVTWHRSNNKWQAKYKGKYIGLYHTVDEAAKAIENFRKQSDT